MAAQPLARGAEGPRAPGGPAQRGGGAPVSPSGGPDPVAQRKAPAFFYLILGHYSVTTRERYMSLVSHTYSGGEQQRTADRFANIGGNAILYRYPGGELDIVCASDKIFAPAGWEAAEDFSRAGRRGPEPARREKGKKSEGADMLRSMRRARANLRRMALANSFEYFVTLTLDPEKIDRYDGAAVVRALGQWCDNMVRRHGLRYILVPERHKDGAFHFHGFMAGPGLIAADSGVQWDGRPVYNLPQWTLGFTTAQRLYGEYSAAVGYCCKYIGKQAGERPLGRWYYSGGALAKPEKIYAALDYRGTAEDYASDAVELEIPGSKLLVIHTKQEVNL